MPFSFRLESKCKMNGRTNGQTNIRQTNKIRNAAYWGLVNAKWCHTTQGAQVTFYGRWASRWTDHWVRDAWPVRRQTYGYLPSRGASPPFDRHQIILLGEHRHMCANNLPRVVDWQCTGRESNPQPCDPTCYTVATPQSHTGLGHTTINN